MSDSGVRMMQNTSWEVLAILGERTNPSSGVIEVLTVWKPSWEPLTSLQASGPVVKQWCEDMKVTRTVELPAEWQVSAPMKAVKRKVLPPTTAGPQRDTCS